jgi:hypothetical protein
MEKKLQISSEVLCRGFPPELAQYLNYCKGLKFDENPDYNYLRNLIKEAMKNNNFRMDYCFDWSDSVTVPEPEQSWLSSQQL